VAVFPATPPPASATPSAMSSTNHSTGGNDHEIPEVISRSSSHSVVSPVVKDGVGEVAARLVEM